MIAYRLSLDLVERDYVLGIERGNAPRIGFKVIDQKGLLDLELVGQALGFNDPGKVGRFHAPVAHRTRDTEAGGVGMQIRFIDKLGNDLVQAGILPAGKDGSGDQTEAAIHGIEKCQTSVGTSNVACQNHFSKSLQ